MHPPINAPITTYKTPMITPIKTYKTRIIAPIRNTFHDCRLYFASIHLYFAIIIALQHMLFYFSSHLIGLKKTSTKKLQKTIRFTYAGTHIDNIIEVKMGATELLFPPQFQFS